MLKAILCEASCRAAKDHQLHMISFQYQAGLSAPITAHFMIERGLITVTFDGLSKSAPISSDASATIAVRNELLRGILIDRAMQQAPIPR